MQVDETADVSTKEQMSVMIRLDKNDNVVERFLKFYNVSQIELLLQLVLLLKIFLHILGIQFTIN